MVARSRGSGSAGRAAWLAALTLVGCEEAPRPWSGQPDGRLRDESSAFLPRRQHGEGPTAWLDAGAGGAAANDQVSEATSSPGATKESAGGGLWVRCYDAFAPSGEPLRDVTRLALMCGPINGLDKLLDARTGRLAGGQAARHDFAARRGECYRVFAVGEPNVFDLDVSITSSRGSRLASDTTDGTWLVLDRDRPFCSFDDDTFSAEVRADGGAGRYAVEVWRLPRTVAMD